MIVAFIPVRGGSKSIPLKNIKPINGKPLVYWTIKAAVDSKYIDRIFVATDSLEIRNVVDSFGFDSVQVISRSPDTASDTASTESAMIEFAEHYTFDTIVLIQATSPLLSSDDIDGGISLYFEDDVDSVLSVVRQKRFIWDIQSSGFVHSLNYDPLDRPRRQDYEGYLVENGAYYITSRSLLLSTGCRISGNTKAYEMKYETYFEIDEPSDWVIIENLLKKSQDTSYDYDFTPVVDYSNVKMFFTDCDGCLTDGGMYYSEFGDELKKFNTKDGVGIANLKHSGIIVGIITGENTDLVRRRAEKLNVDELHMGVRDKLQCVKMICSKYAISLENVAYVGDDLNDIDLLRAVGFSFTVRNASPSVKEHVMYISSKCGGDGAIREIADLILSCK